MFCREEGPLAPRALPRRQGDASAVALFLVLQALNLARSWNAPVFFFMSSHLEKYCKSAHCPIGEGKGDREPRSNYWILRRREAIKRVIHRFLPCRISKATRGTQIEAPLPTDKATPCIPFSTTGIDFRGPLLYVGNSKLLDTAYIALFTCSTVRVLHVQLVSDLTTDKFLMALQRFVGGRGLPYTDNAATFHAASKELISLWNSLISTKVQQFYDINGIKWKFIVSRAAWWERLIGLTKQCLRKSLAQPS
ncbi:hypothetical protein AVEN_46194-1 [Araneus ventricosus]|uniref:Integrase catalytic domain-containing protein n=1 Tax=Araneus ventricosus TaxID=182803 RepID=A0A4Y2E7H3_ARAVE|nr:hypothetical protein AVEN_46194-1 [Araneus ventricosus]